MSSWPFHADESCHLCHERMFSECQALDQGALVSFRVMKKSSVILSCLLQHPQSVRNFISSTRAIYGVLLRLEAASSDDD